MYRLAVFTTFWPIVRKQWVSSMHAGNELCHLIITKYDNYHSFYIMIKILQCVASVSRMCIVKLVTLASSNMITHLKLKHSVDVNVSTSPMNRMENNRTEVFIIQSNQGSPESFQP